MLVCLVMILMWCVFRWKDCSVVWIVFGLMLSEWVRVLVVRMFCMMCGVVRFVVLRLVMVVSLRVFCVWLFRNVWFMISFLMMLMLFGLGMLRLKLIVCVFLMIFVFLIICFVVLLDLL